jgi:DNA-binding MarR family transcriptional regulator
MSPATDEYRYQLGLTESEMSVLLRLMRDEEEEPGDEECIKYLATKLARRRRMLRSRLKQRLK